VYEGREGMSIEAMKQALDVLENTARSAVEQYVAEQKAITALRQAIEQAEKQEPVCDKDPHLCWSVRCQLGKVCKNTAPPKREWVGLTDEEIHKIIDDCTPNEAELEELNDFAKAIFAVEAQLKERNT
jgi:hypothetical protein